MFCSLAGFAAVVSTSIQLKWLVGNVRPHRERIDSRFDCRRTETTLCQEILTTVGPGMRAADPSGSNQSATAALSQRTIKVNCKPLFYCRIATFCYFTDGDFTSLFFIAFLECTFW